MNISLLFKIFSSISPWLIVKIFALIWLGFYIIFAGIIVRQIELMNKILEAKFSPIIRLIALIHLGLTISLFLLALVIL